MYLDFYTGYGGVKISLSCCCCSSSCTSLSLYLLQESPMSKVKKVDCTLLPPCALTVRNKLRRAHYISLIWCNADGPQPGNGLDHTKYGWVERNGCYVPDWFSGPAIPDDFLKRLNKGMTWFRSTVRKQWWNLMSRINKRTLAGVKIRTAKRRYNFI